MEPCDELHMIGLYIVITCYVNHDRNTILDYVVTQFRGQSCGKYCISEAVPSTRNAQKVHAVFNFWSESVRRQNSIGEISRLHGGPKWIIQHDVCKAVTTLATFSTRSVIYINGKILTVYKTQCKGNNVIYLQELIRRWDSERELLGSAPGSYPNSLK